MKGSDKTRRQEIELFLLEKERLGEGKEEKWKKLSGAEKTRQQEIELFLFGKGRVELDELREVCESEWENLSGIEKTKKQAVELMISEQGKGLNLGGKVKKKWSELGEKEKEMFEMLAILNEEKFRKMLAEQKISMEDFFKEYVGEREFSSKKLVKLISGIDKESKDLTPLAGKKIGFYVSGLESTAERVVRKKSKLEAVLDAGEQKKKELEFSSLQNFILSSLGGGYQIEVGEAKKY